MTPETTTIGTDILAYGRLLHCLEGKPGRGTDDAKSVEHFLKFRVDLEHRLSFSPIGHKLLPLVLGVAVESNETAVLSLVVFRAVCTDCGPSSVASLAETCCGGDVSRVIAIRQATFRLVKRGVLRCVPAGQLPYSGMVVPSGKTLNTLFGSRGGPAFFDESMVSRTSTDMGMETEWGNRILTVSELSRRISARVIGIDGIVKEIATRVVMHLHRSELIKKGMEAGCPEVLLMIGNSGSGKTHTATTAAASTGRGWSLTDCTSVTAEGYVGYSADQPLRSLIQSLGGDVARAEAGSLLICDEIDKRRGSLGGDGVDVSGRAVQQSFLTQIESKGKLTVGGRRGFDREYQMDGRRLGWIFCGAFAGLDSLLKREERAGIGFGGEGVRMRRGFRLFDALRDYGFIDEFLNRLTGVIRYPDPTTAQLERITVSRHGPIAVHNRLLDPMGVRISLSKGAVRRLAEFGGESRMFARGITLVVRHIVAGVAGSGAKGGVKISERDAVAAIGAISSIGIEGRDSKPPLESIPAPFH